MSGADDRGGEGTLQGGPLSPLLANMLLDEVDKELERRGHAFVRHAEDRNLPSAHVRATGRRPRCASWFGKLKLRVKETNSKVRRATPSNFLGFSLTIERMKERVRELAPGAGAIYQFVLSVE